MVSSVLGHIVTPATASTHENSASPWQETCILWRAWLEIENLQRQIVDPRVGLFAHGVHLVSALLSRAAQVCLRVMMSPASNDHGRLGSCRPCALCVCGPRGAVCGPRGAAGSWNRFICSFWQLYGVMTQGGLVTRDGADSLSERPWRSGRRTIDFPHVVVASTTKHQRRDGGHWGVCAFPRPDHIFQTAIKNIRRRWTIDVGRGLTSSDFSRLRKE